MLSRIRGLRGRGASAPRAFVVTLCAVLVTAGCNNVVDGSASKETGGPAAGAADPALLDVGNYPTKPRPPLGTSGADGAIIEGQRMADFVTGPWEADPALIGGYGFGAMVLKSSAPLKGTFSTEIVQAIGGPDFINGFVTARSIEHQRILANSVLRYRTPEAAKVAADALARAALETKVITPPVETTAIPRHPESSGISHVVVETDSDRRWSVAQAVTAHGPYVLLQQAESTDGLDPALELIAKTLDLQAPLIDQFQPTDPEKFADLPRDPTGLLARTLPVPEKTATVVQNATFGQHGTLHFQSNPVTASTLFSETGMDTMVRGMTVLNQAKDDAGATRIATAFADETAAMSRPADPVEHLPGSRCMQIPSGSFYCTAAAGRYAIESSATQLPDAQQQLAAQYLMALAK